MTIEVKLFATLRKHLPPGGDGKSTSLELPEGATVTDVIDALKIPRAQAQLIMVDGHHVHDPDTALDRDGVGSIFPALAGGAT